MFTPIEGGSESEKFLWPLSFFKNLYRPLRSLGQGNIFRSVCQEFCPGGGACVAGGMHGRGHVWQGACMAGGACVAWGPCMVGGGMCGREGVHGRGACVVGGCVWHAHPRQILRDMVNEHSCFFLSFGRCEQALRNTMKCAQDVI